MTTLILATRSSRLARSQSQWVADQLTAVWPELEVTLHFIRSEGDADRTSSLALIGGQGLFTRAVDEAVQNGKADFAVHSLKDLPTLMTPGLVLAAVPVREDTADLLAGSKARSLNDLPCGATIATGSLRRRAQLLAVRPDLILVDIRGNVETRLARVTEEGYAGTVLAAAGLNRLKLSSVPCLSLAGVLLPAIGQGALGVVCRGEDIRTQALLRVMEDSSARAEITAERTFLREVEAGCHAPAGVRSILTSSSLSLEAAVFSPDGSRVIRASADGPREEAEAIGRRVALTILARGGRELLSAP